MNVWFLPPLGFTAPVLASSIIALWLLPDNVVVPSIPLPSTEVKTPRQSLNLGGATELATAIQQFADRPLLAENRQLPVLVSPEPIVPTDVIQPELVTSMDPEPEQPPLIVQPPKLSVIGLMSINDTPYILIHDREMETETWASVGQSFGEWDLIEITQVGAILRSQDTKITIKLFDDTLR